MQALITKSNCSYSTRNAKRVELPQNKSIRYGYNSFTYNGAFIWNNLPNEIKQEFDIKVFKRLINIWNAPQCNCSACKLCSLKMM